MIIANKVNGNVMNSECCKNKLTKTTTIPTMKPLVTPHDETNQYRPIWHWQK